MWTCTLHRAFVLLLCGSSLVFLGTDAVKSKYVCQGEKLRLHCKRQFVISIYAANFGRLEPGSSICPHPNISTLNCKAPQVLLKMTQRCANKQKCTVKADPSVFGDACPGTWKYLDVIYGCVLGVNWTPTPTGRKAKHRTTTQNPTRSTTESLSTATTKTTKLRTTRKTFKQNTSGPTQSNITSSITTNITTTRMWSLKVTAWNKEPTSTTLPPKVPKDPKTKASGRRGEERVIMALLRSLYLTYRFIKDNPRDTLVVFLSSVAGGTVFLLAFLLAVHVCKKHRRNRKFAMKRKKAGKSDEADNIKSVTIEIQGSDDETKEINVKPGDVIIIDHNDPNQSGSEDLGYLSEIVRFYNSQNIGSDDQISIRKQFSNCDSPSVISTSESRDSKYDSAGINIKQCTCQQGALLRPSSPLGVM